MAEAPRDQNHVTSLLLESSTNPGVVFPAKGDQTTGRILTDSAAVSEITVTDGVTSVQAATIDFISGATVTDGGGGIAEVSIDPPTPAGPNGALQYNNGGVEGGSEKLTWDDDLRFLTIGVEALASRVRAVSATTPNTNGGSISIRGGFGNGTGQNGYAALGDPIGDSFIVGGTIVGFPALPGLTTVNSGFGAFFNTANLNDHHEFAFPDSDGTLITDVSPQSLSNKTINGTNTITARDNLFTIEDNGDTTKRVQFQVSGVTTGVTRTLTIPNANGTIALSTDLTNFVTGPGSAVSGNIATFNGTTGKIIQDGGKALPTGAIVGTTDTQTLSGKTLTSPSIASPTITTQWNFGSNTAYFTEFDNGNSGTSDTINWTVSNKQRSTLTGNVTFTFTAPGGPCNLVLVLIQDGTGSRLVTWPASVKWAGGVAPTLTTTAGRVDIVSFYYNGTNYYGQAALNYTP